MQVPPVAAPSPTPSGGGWENVQVGNTTLGDLAPALLILGIIALLIFVRLMVRRPISGDGGSRDWT